MNEVKISELQQANNLKDGCCFPLVQDNETKKVTFETIKNELTKNSMGNIIVDSIRSKNLTGPIFYNKGLTNQGAVTDNSSWFVTDYIGVKENTNYVQTGFSSNFVAFYDSNKSFIDSTLATNKTFQTPANTAYIRMNGKISESSNMQIEEGDTATNYSEYKGLGYTSGSNENGKWVKYDDGRMECWNRQLINISCSNSWGGFYTSSTITLNDFPVVFKDIPTVVISVDGNYATAIISAGFNTNTTPMKFQLMRAIVETSNHNRYIHYHAYGYWK